MADLGHFTRMKLSTAQKLIEQHRGRSRFRATDYAVARRSEHLYSGLAAFMAMIAFRNLSAEHFSWLRFSFGLTLALFTVCLSWQGWRFAAIRRLFEERGPQKFSDLHDNRSIHPT